MTGGQGGQDRGGGVRALLRKILDTSGSNADDMTTGNGINIGREAAARNSTAITCQA